MKKLDIETEIMLICWVVILFVVVLFFIDFTSQHTLNSLKEYNHYR